MKYTESLEFMTLQKQITVGVTCGHVLLFLEFGNKRIHPGIFLYILLVIPGNKLCHTLGKKYTSIPPFFLF